MNTMKLSAWLGLILSAVLIFQKVNQDQHMAQSWPLLVYDYLAPALLAIGAVAVLRGGTGRWLAAGWGFGIATTYLAFFNHMDFSVHTRPDLTFSGALSVPAGVLLGVNLVGFLLTLWPSHRPTAAHAAH